jgi:hypothetical protein
LVAANRADSDIRPRREECVRLEVVGDPPPLEVEGTVGAGRIDRITLEDDRGVARPGDGEQSRQARDATAGDDELHAPKLSGPRVGRQAAVPDEFGWLGRSEGR